ncbi:MAG: hypothetical protein U9Q29_07095 [Campylobacterota bacterium]|nr:hypothetical protein [Campylobacterota bacterium]
MSKVIGTVASIDGEFYAKSVDGSLREISKGDEIYEGETVVGDKNNSQLESIIISMSDGTDIVVLGSESQLFDASLFSTEFSEDETVTHKESVIAMLEDSANVDDVDELETAGGEDEPVESSEGGEAKFATSNDKNFDVDINAELRERAFDNTIDDAQTQATVAQAENDSDDAVSALKDAADLAAQTANTAVAAAEASADTLADIENLTQAQIDETQGLADDFSGFGYDLEIKITNNDTNDYLYLDKINMTKTANEAVEAVEAVDAVAESFAYEVTLNAGLTDTDGSESLSSITVDNIPTGATIDGLTANADGSYTVPVDVNGDATVTLTSSTEKSNTDLNSIQSSITSTESDGGETHTTMAHTSLDESSDTGNDSYDVSDDNTIDAGDGKDAFTADATDIADNGLSLDGGEGLDTLIMSDDMNIDFSVLDDNIANMEVIDLGAGTQNITSLSTEDVLTMTDTDDVLRIDGDSADSIDLNTQGSDAEWTLGDFKTDAETGATYQEVTGGEGDATVTLEISTDIEIHES